MQSDNVFDKNLAMFINKLEFTKRSIFVKLSTQMKEVAADYFTNGDLKEADKLLDGQSHMSRKDVCMMAYVSGACTFIAASFIFYMY